MNLSRVPLPNRALPGVVWSVIILKTVCLEVTRMVNIVCIYIIYITWTHFKATTYDSAAAVMSERRFNARTRFYLHASQISIHHGARFPALNHHWLSSVGADDPEYFTRYIKNDIIMIDTFWNPSSKFINCKTVSRSPTWQPEIHVNSKRNQWYSCTVDIP